jgi:hypothetical protein
MRAQTTSSDSRFVHVARQRARTAQFLGLAIASLVPAALWCLLIKAVASWIGTPLALRTVLFTGAAIAIFLALVCAPVVLRDRV